MVDFQTKVNSFLSQSGSDPGKLKDKWEGLNPAKFSRLNVMSIQIESIYIHSGLVQCYLGDVLSTWLYVMYSGRGLGLRNRTKLVYLQGKKMPYILRWGRNKNDSIFFYNVDNFLEVKVKLKCFTLFFSSMLQMKTDEKLNLSDGNTASCPLSPIKMCLNRPIEWNLNLTAASLASCTVHNQNLKNEEK